MNQILMAAKLHNPILFCNDINLKTLIDIFTFDDEHLLITCKAFIKRFKVSERKQVNSWVTKSWHPFTCGAVKNLQNDSIYAVTNHSSLWIWPVSEDIENADKYVFTSEIKELKPCKKTIYIIYSCGFVESVPTALSRCKQKKRQLLETDEEICQSQVFGKGKEVALLIQNKRKQTFLLKQKVGSKAEPSRIQIELKNFSLTGSSIFSSGTLVTIWSDGNLYITDILNSTQSFSLGSPKGRISALNSNKEIKILELSENHMALQGMKTNEEGGIVVLWDTKFGVSVSSKALKMYREPPLAWSLGSYVVVGDGGHLIYIPVSLAPSTIASLFGARIGEKLASSDECVSWVASAGDEKVEIEREVPLSASQTILSNKSDNLSNLISSMEQGSTSEDIIVNLVVSELVKRKDMKLLFECLSAFTYIPEKALIDILKFFIELPEKHFVTCSPALEELEKKGNILKNPEAKANGERKRRHRNKDSGSLTTETYSEEELQKEKDHGENVKTPFSIPKAKAINAVLVKPFTASQLSREIRSMDFTASLLLLEHLHFLLASGTAKILSDGDTKIPSIEMTSVWLSLLLDANYHHLIMTSEVEIHRKLLTCFSNITSLHEFLEASHSIDNLVETILSMKPMPKSKNNMPYSIERLILP